MCIIPISSYLSAKECGFSHFHSPTYIGAVFCGRFRRFYRFEIKKKKMLVITQLQSGSTIQIT